MINGIKIYEIVFMFAAFSVLGYVVEQCVCIAMGNVAKRGVLAGPYGAVYGIAAAITTVFLGPVPEREDYQYITSYISGIDEDMQKWSLLLVLAGLSFILYYGLAMVLKVMSGRLFYSLNPVYPLLAFLCAMVAALQLRPFLLLLASGLPPILLIIVTVVITGGMFTNAVDAVPALVDYHGQLEKESPWVPVGGTPEEETSQGPFDHLKTVGAKEPTAEEQIISRWERAYPLLRKKR